MDIEEDRGIVSRSFEWVIGEAFAHHNCFRLTGRHLGEVKPSAFDYEVV